MTDDKLTDYLKRVTADLKRTRQRIRELESGAVEPVAIIGMGCRYPGGVASPEDLWDLVAAGRDAISAFPTDRGWAVDELGVSFHREGGFVHDATEFDADLFGISPREALAMDPQQRLLLETSWETLERAGIDPTSVRGSNGGVFVGMTDQRYGPRDEESLRQVGGFGLTGMLSAAASGRIAYTLGLEGPTMTIDTACSASLVAVHLAVRALRAGECSFALAGGAMVMTSLLSYIEMAQQGGLAGDGRCKAFGAGADGTGWGEGVGLVLLERLSDARRLGHEVLAVVRGSAVNQDGASNGLTAPNGPSQERLIRRALDDAGLSPGQVDVVEAHGTGTRLGDPIEAQALLATYGRGRPVGRPLWLGSVKSNIGHTQGAAGVAGVIKMVMALRHGVLPPTLHVGEPTSQVDWSSGGVRLLTEVREWPEVGRPRRAGVSSFGISGTNAHVIVEQAPPQNPTTADGTPSGTSTVGPASSATRFVPWIFAANGIDALREQAGHLSSYPDRPDRTRVTDVGYSLAVSRAALQHRAVVVAENQDGFRAGLEAIAAGRDETGVVTGLARKTGKTVFMFPGQGGQWAGMGKDLWESSAVFASTLQACSDALAPHVDWSLVDVIRGAEGAPALERVDVVQPALWAVMVALADLWRSMGVEPEAVVGHSQGEIAAACVAGGLSLEDGALIVALRSRLIAKRLSGIGGMVSLSTAPDRVEPLLAPWSDRVDVAAVNGPASVVVSGDTGALDELLVSCEREGVWARRIAVDYASHSAQVAALRADLIDGLAAIVPRTAPVSFVSTVTGDRLDTADLTADYWYRNLRSTVLFEQVVRQLSDQGFGVFLELSPHPVLTAGVQGTLESAEPVVVGSLRRDEGDAARFLTSVAEAWVQGVDVDWSRAFEKDNPRVVELPTYAFQRKRYWLETPSSVADMRSAGLIRPDHPLLGAIVEQADSGARLFNGLISLTRQPWLRDHAVAGTVLFPGAAFVELALYAGRQLGCGRLAEFIQEVPLALSEQDDVRLQVVVGVPDESGHRSVEIYSRPDDGGEIATWSCHARGVLAHHSSPPPGMLGDVWPPTGAEAVDLDRCYERLAVAGLEYGPAFQGLRHAWQLGDDLFIDVAVPADIAVDTDHYGVHPVLLDAALHAGLLPGLTDGTGDVPIPFSWSDISIHSAGTAALRGRLSRTAANEVSVLLTDSTGAVVVEVGSLVARSVSTEQLEAARGEHRNSLYRLRWTQHSAVAGQASLAHEKWAFVGDDDLQPTMASSSVAPQRVASLEEMTDPTPEAVFLPCTVNARGDAEADRVRASVNRALEAVQQWLADDRFASALLVVLTRGAVSAGEHEDVSDLAGAAVWGLVRSAQTENPERIVLADFDRDTITAESLSAVVQANEPQVVVRDSAVLVPRLAPVTADRRPVPWGPSGTVLVTGASGTLGRLVARHLVASHGARELLLVSRRGAAFEGQAELTVELTELGARVTWAACDVADREATSELLASLPSDQPLTAVVHTAGVLDDGVVQSLTPERLDRVFRPKVDAVLNLHELTADMDLSAFLVFSSAAGILGAAGQANYAAANAFTDALAVRRRAHGLPAVSLAWGLWAEASDMTAQMGIADRARLGRSGIVGLSNQQGLAAFDAAIALDQPVTVPMRIDMRALRAAAVSSSVSPALRGLLPISLRRAADSVAVGRDTLRDRLSGMPDSDRDRALLNLIRGHVATVLRHASPTAIEPDRSFKELGFDSLTAVELRNRLNVATGLRLPATLVFDHPTATVLAEHLKGELLRTGDASGPSTLFTRLDELRAALPGLSSDDAARTEVEARLRALLAELNDISASEENAADDRILRANTLDEVFHIIDDELEVLNLPREG
ncbi:SDR family NAD(P)-dependent oxidoreductase [Nocardia terpenica]|uniref:SDR family NAD(P)-dependent oxidoreductase n=1 Tax=Nocardia terpenica TaxID=455432 RepID=A0A6G9Z955_9NOCA|nr:type I polyketide synthase [Nocardia terpenica]QIS22139.1 SDR family NAD(P)-dependent oxidoreductase [Nocardia terpenica]